MIINITYLKRITCVIFSSLISITCLAQERIKPLDVNTLLTSVNRFYPQIIIARLEVAKAQGNFVNALGKFDPALKIYSRSQPFGGYVNGYVDNELVVPTLVNGIKLFGGYRLGRGDWPIYYQNYLTNSGGEYRVGFSLALLKGHQIDKERTLLLTQGERIVMNTQDVAAKKIEIYRDAIQAYWQWVEAGLQLKALNNLLSLAKERQKAIVKQANQGDLPRLSIAENRQLILQREQLANQSRMLFQQAAINLSIYYRDKHGQPKVPHEGQLIKAVLSPVKKVTQSTASIKAQLRCHPALNKLRSYYRIIKFKQNLAKNDLLPELDATFYTSKQYGSGGYPRLIPQAGYVGLQFWFPLYQREAKGRLISTTSELKQIAAEKKFIYEQLNSQLQNFFIATKIYYQQVRLLYKELELAKQVQSGEIKKFYAGDSTLFLINQREQATAQIELNLIAAQVNLQKTKDFIQFFSSTKYKKGGVVTIF
ncbi:TolC family protein [Legionella gresilensis]|uniref:TolC family protein n=1 Tax=Legionella gresilensis TaxID=91823 RepID=UPI001041B1B5|nr:TolC family protein [Legionella gresilensis]